jgi:transcriptional regulator with XRE-family HTH domain
MNFAKRLTELRHSRSKTQNALTTALTLNIRTVCVHENPTRPMMPSYETLIKIAGHYNCPAESLLY